MAADIYTKAFTDPLKWQGVLELINILDPKLLSDKRYMELLEASSPTQSGGFSLRVSFLIPKGLLLLRVGTRIKKHRRFITS